MPANPGIFKTALQRLGTFPFRDASAVLVGILFVLAGLNHFRNPEFYIDLVPRWLGQSPSRIIWLSGWVELLLGLLVFPKRTRRLAGFGLVALLVVFVPAHIFFIQNGNCLGNVCFPVWQGWVRLLVLQPLLILWVGWSSNIFFLSVHKASSSATLPP